MRKILLFLTCLQSIHVAAQVENFRVTFNVGNPLELNVSDIKDVTFVEDQKPINLIGEWFNLDEEMGIFSSFVFHEDGTLTYKSFVELDTDSVDGAWAFQDYILGVSYMNRKSIVPITNHSETTFIIRKNNKNYIYYKVQKIYNMTTLDTPISIGNDNDIITYVDNAVIGLEGNKIKAIQQGYGFALVTDSKLNTTVAYRVNVEYAPGPVIDWSNYFKKTKDDIIAEFGTPDAISTDARMGEMIDYAKGYNGEIKQLTFIFDKTTGKSYMLNVVFYGKKELDTYKDVIEKNYIFKEEDKDGIRYYINNDGTISISMNHKDSPYYINYLDLSDK